MHAALLCDLTAEWQYIVRVTSAYSQQNPTPIASLFSPEKASKQSRDRKGASVPQKLLLRTLYILVCLC
jgi:hypothetical protein